MATAEQLIGIISRLALYPDGYTEEQAWDAVSTMNRLIKEAQAVRSAGPSAHRSYFALGVRDQDGQVVARKIVAESPGDAIEELARDNGYSSDFLVVGAMMVASDFDPEKHFVTPCEDSGGSAYAVDLQPDDSEEGTCPGGCGRPGNACTKGECDCGGCHDNDEDCDAMKERLGIDREDGSEG